MQRFMIAHGHFKNNNHEEYLIHTPVNCRLSCLYKK